MMNSVKNAFKHPEEESESASGYGRESKRGNMPAAGDQQTQDLKPDQSTGQDYDQQQNTSRGNQSQYESSDNPVRQVQDSVPSTGYVGDNTTGRFPGQEGYGASTSDSDSTGAFSSSTANDRSGGTDYDAQDETRSKGETGREGVPGTVTSGDPSMGGKHNTATSGSERDDAYQGGDPSMGNKYTRAEGRN